MRYEKDRKWSDQYIPLIKEIVGPHLLMPSPDIIDRNEAADLILLEAGSMTIACRIRRPGFLKYKNEFTIRNFNIFGAKTELDKFVEGFADWMFYGHAGKGSEISIVHWFLIDLKSFRAHLIRRNPSLKFGDRLNPDGETGFKWFDITTFGEYPPLLIASSEMVLGI